MEQITLKIPLSFVERTLGRLTWRTILFGLENELLDPAAASQAAAASLDQLDPSPELIELAAARDGEPVLTYVRQLAELESPSADPQVSERWLFLVLAWLFENRGDLPDPLQTVETVYAEFDYPEEMAGFVRYMPSDDPDLGSPKLNQDRLVDKWGRFLRQQRERLGEE